MEIQYPKMILYGSIRAIFYMIIPLISIFILSVLEIVTFSNNFIISLLVIGCIGVFLTILKHIYPKQTVANRLIAFAVKIYQGIYLFYVFGGFNPGVKLGTYYISTTQVQVLLGLQFIAWLLLGIAGITAIQNLIEAIELQKEKNYLLRGKKQIKLSKFFKTLGLILNLAMGGYVLSIVISGLNLKVDLKKSYAINWNTGTIPDPSDDRINITMYFDVFNMGIYSIKEIYLDADIYTVVSFNFVTLPEDTKIGEINNVYFSEFKALFITRNQTVLIEINPLYAPGLAITDAILEFRISFMSIYAGISIELNTSITVLWSKLFTP
ncbi:MAG: hypothetical protein ACFFB4_03085 [Promethearchaeota archaeon]